jgi:hypothetical protein
MQCPAGLRHFLRRRPQGKAANLLNRRKDFDRRGISPCSVNQQCPREHWQVLLAVGAARVHPDSHRLTVHRCNTPPIV